MNIPSEQCLKCKHYQGGKLFDEIDTDTEYQEGVFLPTCAAFPNGIPDEINDGDNLHTKPLKTQGNDIVFEKKQ